MGRNKRKKGRHNNNTSNIQAVRTNEAERLIDNILTEVGVPESEKMNFFKSIVKKLWDIYTDEKLEKQKHFELAIRDLHIIVPNGTDKEAFSCTIDLNEMADKVKDIDLIEGEQTGLSLTRSEDGAYTLVGKPAATGDFKLRLQFTAMDDDIRTPVEIELPWAVNRNPRDLWKEVDCDPSLPFLRPDTDAEYIKAEAKDGSPRKDVVAASRRGRSHAQEGKPRDDDFSIKHCEASDWYILAVADGAGSAKYSRRGAQVACDTVTSRCMELLEDNTEFEKAIADYAADREDKEKQNILSRMVYTAMSETAHEAHRAVCKLPETEKEVEGATVRDFSTTLMFAVCKRFDFGWFIASFWVGDGAMCLYDENAKTAKLLGTPDEGEFSGQTRFLTMKEIFRNNEELAKRVRMTIVPDFTALMLMTDGVSDAMFQSEKDLNDPDKWAEMYGKLRQGFPDDEIGGVDLTDDNEEAKDQLLGWLNFWSRGNHDDRTIAILY